MNEENSINLPNSELIPFIAIQTEKNIYYPGETIKGAVFMRVAYLINRVDRLALLVHGKESYKFLSKDKKVKSLKSSREVVNDRVVLCSFIP